MRIGAAQATTGLRTNSSDSRSQQEGSRFNLWMGDGAEDRSRTDDLLITNQLLYQLSYFGLLSDCIVALVEGKVEPCKAHRRHPIQALLKKETIMALTIHLAFRIAIVWAAGILVAVAVRALLPTGTGLTFAGSKTALFVPYDRIGFWTCILAALTVNALVVIRAMLLDFGWNSIQ